MSTATDFIEALWGPAPLRGYAQIWTLADRASTYLQDPAAAVNFEGRPDVFCAVGMTTRRLGARQRAKADQVAAISGFFLDLDVEPGKIPTREDAFTLAWAHLEPTIVVDSGAGLHCWYLLPQPWLFHTRDEQQEAASLARRFVTLHQQTAAKNGWRIDSVGDLARLLRLPGSLNAKDPDKPRPVVWLGIGNEVGPRNMLNDFRHLLRDVPVDEPRARAGGRGPVTLTGDTSAFAAKLDALLANSPEFAARWNHDTAPADDSLSAYDLSLCSMAAGAMTDPELADLIRLHRLKHGGPDAMVKAQRTKYLADTIAKARERTERAGQIAALEAAGRRRAA